MFCVGMPLLYNKKSLKVLQEDQRPLIYPPSSERLLYSTMLLVPDITNFTLFSNYFHGLNQYFILAAAVHVHKKPSMNESSNLQQAGYTLQPLFGSKTWFTVFRSE